MTSTIKNARDWWADALAMVRVAMHQRNVKKAVKAKCKDLDFCYEKLQKVSRSFAAVIMALGDELRDAICIFYLVLRGLDTVEDDMSIPLDVKCPELLAFHEKLDQPGWHITGYGVADERELLEKFEHVIAAFQRLKPELQGPIKDIAREMGKGMAKYQRQTEPIDSIEEYEKYCYYVAGLVGHGLTRLFVASGLESEALGKELELANSMGLFLQKVNIIRDYLEDIENEPPRIFWPKEVWGMFTSDFHSFKDEAHRPEAVKCLNLLIADAVKHIPDCLTYLSLVKDKKNFEFCAIPQTMAIATLCELYDNQDVFTRNVKITKGLACRLILDSRELSSVRMHFRKFLNNMNERAVSGGDEQDIERIEFSNKIQVIVNKIEEDMEEERLRKQQEMMTYMGGQTILSAIVLTFWAGLHASALSMVEGIFGKQ